MFPPLTRAMKKEITKQWQELFPSMGVYKPMWLGNICGPLFVGLLLHVKSDNDRYTPTLHIHYLCKNVDFVSLGLEITDNFNYVSTRSPEDKYLKIAKSLTEKAIVPLEGDIDLLKLLADLRNCFTWYRLEYILLEHIVYLSVWTGKQEIVDSAWKLVEEMLIEKPEMFNSQERRDMWYNNLPRSADEAPRLRETVEQQIISLKLDKLPRREMICK